MKKILSFMYVFIWIITVFLLSNQTGDTSKGLSQNVTDIVVGVIEKATNSSINDIELAHYIIRKIAHFTIYFVLGILVLYAFPKEQRRRLDKILLALIICVVLAFLDEFHQYFTFGRDATLLDVQIDSLGALMGIISFLVIHKIFETKEEENINKQKKEQI